MPVALTKGRKKAKNTKHKTGIKKKRRMKIALRAVLSHCKKHKALLEKEKKRRVNASYRRREREWLNKDKLEVAAKLSNTALMKLARIRYPKPVVEENGKDWMEDLGMLTRRREGGGGAVPLTTTRKYAC